MAVVIESKHIKGKKAWRLIFMLPWAIPAFVSILFYKVIFDSSASGFINTILMDWGITTSAIDWMKDQTMSRMILILIQGWLGHSYILLLVTGNMKSISGDVYEAASIDGATKFQQFWKLTIPIILLQIAPLLIGQFTFNFTFWRICLQNIHFRQLCPFPMLDVSTFNMRTSLYLHYQHSPQY
jgi:arabinogalactan oligomer/maltooligosaccharide transport system permease protein